MKKSKHESNKKKDNKKQKRKEEKEEKSTTIRRQFSLVKYLRKFYVSILKTLWSYFVLASKLQ